jgi:BASS family bile acid:Na+ symporter
MEIVIKIAPPALALIMLGLGMSLKVQDFIRVVKFPIDFLVGFICQMLVLPIIAFALIKLLNTPIELALGVMIIAAAPGGVTSNVLTKFANGDVALSISLTAIISLISIVSVPFIIFLSIDLLNIDYVSKDISMMSISLKMFFVVTVPVIIGMTFRHFSNEKPTLKGFILAVILFFPAAIGIIIGYFSKGFIAKNDLLFQKISAILFAVVFAAIYIEEWNKIVSFITRAGFIALILNIVMMIVGFYVAKFFSTGVAQQRCISLECGLQNGTLAVFVSTQLFDKMVYVVPTAAYALIMMITSIIFVFIIKKNT